MPGQHPGTGQGAVVGGAAAVGAGLAVVGGGTGAWVVGAAVGAGAVPSVVEGDGVAVGQVVRVPNWPVPVGVDGERGAVVVDLCGVVDGFGFGETVLLGVGAGAPIAGGAGSRR